VRIDSQDHERLLTEPDVRDFDLSGRPMKGGIVVGPDSGAADEDLARWIERGLAFAAGLPPK
jgi:hypothetical protein